MTRGNSILDYAVHGMAVKVSCDKVLPSPSNHASILWSVEIKVPRKNKPQRIPNKVLAQRISKEAIEDDASLNSIGVLRKFLDLKKQNKRKWFKLIKRKPRAFLYIDLLLELENEDDITEETRIY